MFLLYGVPSAFTVEISQERTNDICAQNYVQKSKLIHKISLVGKWRKGLIQLTDPSG